MNYMEAQCISIDAAAKTVPPPGIWPPLMSAPRCCGCLRLHHVALLVASLMRSSHRAQLTCGCVRLYGIALYVASLMRGLHRAQLTCQYTKPFRDLEAHTFTIPYDVLVFATGAVRTLLLHS